MRGRDGAKRFWLAVTAGIVGTGVWLRRRVVALEVIEPSDEPPAPTHLVVTAAGVEVDPATLRAASRHMRRHGLEALDLVPGDLPAERLFEVVWLTDPATFRSAPLARARGALSALVLTEDLAGRLGLGATTDNRFRVRDVSLDRDVPYTERTEGLSPVEMLRLTIEAKRYAPLSTDLAVAPALRAAAAGDDATTRYACLEASYTVATPMVLGGYAVSLALIVAGALHRRPAALAAVAAHELLPSIVTRGTAVAPRDVPGRGPIRLVAEGLGLAQMVALRRRVAAPDPELDTGRREYERMLAGGVDALFEPRRATCPLCDADRLRLAIEMPDVAQRKPGTFRVEECEACGHLFQNPRLTPAGLDFYYRDVYDGLGADSTEIAFSAGQRSYRGRAELVAEVTEPRRWLDVGAGHGHFCLLAQSIWPKATFDGLDLSDGIDLAEQRGWVRRGWRGSFPDLAPELARSYDVVSMHHYLEHTREPAAELDAAAEVLEPGGHLLIELPDASSWLGRRLGRYWLPWLQPQHQHFLSVERLEAMLRDRGFTVVACQRSEPHQAAELMAAVQLAINRLCPPVDVPWRPPSTRRDRRRRAAVEALAAPVFVLAAGVDTLLGPILSRIGASNAFRVLARAPGA